MKRRRLECYVDGGCNNITKSGGFGSYVIFGKDEVVKSDLFLLDEAKTSNEAEYMAMIKLLEYINLNNHIDTLEWEILSDSKLVVNSLIRNYRITASNLRPLYLRSKKLLKNLHNARLHWIPGKDMKRVLGH